VSTHEAGIVEFIKERRRVLEVAGFVHEEARRRISAEGVPGMDEAKLHLEWLNDVLADPDESAWASASSDPAVSYDAFLERRLADPYRVSYRAVRALERKIGPYDANKFVYLHWNQEVAWAQRLRASDCKRTAILSHMFLINAGKDTGKAFCELASAWETAWGRADFSRSISHGLTEHAIRDGQCLPEHVPVYLSLYEATRSSGIDRLPAAKIAEAALSAANVEAVRVRGALASKAAATARRTPLSRILGIIGVAAASRRDAATLWFDERRFLVEIEQGRVPCTTTGLPYTEFVNWLRAAAPGDPPGEPPPGHEAHRALHMVLTKPSSWLASLPADYAAAGATDAACYHAWIRPIASGAAPVPWDMAAAYGFHLSGRSFRP